MSKDPESVLFVRRVLQINQIGERRLLPARHAAIVDRYAYSKHIREEVKAFANQVKSGTGYKIHGGSCKNNPFKYLVTLYYNH
jgi:hypothetical protein